MTFRCTAHAAAAACLAFAATAASADDFYKGRQVTLVIGNNAGTSYDASARLMARHFGRHIPGQPTFVTQNMPGATGLIAANHVSNVAPQDGSSLLVPLKPLAMTQLLRDQGVKYDAGKFNWIGSMVDVPGVIAVWNTSPAKTLAEAQKTEIVLGSSGFGAETFIFPTVLNAVLNTKFKVVAGYGGMSDIFLAMERGEANGVSTVYGSLAGLKPEWIREKKVAFMVQVAQKRAPELPDVPTVLELATSPDQKQVLDFLTLSDVIGRAITAPPKIPADRLAALRAAFDRTVASEAYRKEGKERGMELNPTSGLKVQEAIARLIATPEPVVEKVREALATAQKRLGK